MCHIEWVHLCLCLRTDDIAKRSRSFWMHKNRNFDKKFFWWMNSKFQNLFCFVFFFFRSMNLQSMCVYFPFFRPHCWYWAALKSKSSVFEIWYLYVVSYFVLFFSSCSFSEAIRKCAKYGDLICYRIFQCFGRVIIMLWWDNRLRVTYIFLVWFHRIRTKYGHKTATAIENDHHRCRHGRTNEYHYHSRKKTHTHIIYVDANYIYWHFSLHTSIFQQYIKIDWLNGRLIFANAFRMLDVFRDMVGERKRKRLVKKIFLSNFWVNACVCWAHWLCAHTLSD